MSAIPEQERARDPLAVVRAYAAAGFRVLPIHTAPDGRCSCGAANCHSPGKHPRTEHGVDDATTALETIDAWATRWPGCNWGMALDNLVAIDCDPRHGGDITAQLLIDKHGGAWPDTATAITGGGGWHRVYGAQADARYPGTLGPGVDLKHGAGAYIVVEPSTHASGRPYSWIDGTDPQSTPPALAPAWLGNTKGAGKTRTGTGTVRVLDDVVADLKSALAVFNPDDYSDWIYVAHCFKELGDQGLELWDAWAKSSPKYGDGNRDPIAVWNSINPTHATYRALFAQAQARGWQNPKANAQRIENQARAQAARADDPRPVIALAQGERAQALDKIDAVLAGTGRVFQRGQRVVHVSHAPAKVRGIEIPEQVPHISEATAGWIACKVDELARVERITKHGEAKQADCPRELATLYTERHDAWQLPAVRGIASTPLLLPDGTINCAHGYDPHSGLWLDWRGGELAVPEHPTRADALAAVQRLAQLVDTFPFADDKIDRVIAVAALMAAALRPSLARCPAFAFVSPTPATGKTKLARTIGALCDKTPPLPLTYGHSSEEFEKSLSTAVILGTPVTLVDNINADGLNSNTLAVAVTEGGATIRIFGSNRDAMRVECSTLWLITGNNLWMADDLLRRVLVCELDPGVEDPELRRFASDPEAIAREHRGDYLRDVHIIVRAFRQSGEQIEAVPFAGFDDFVAYVRDPLVWLGWPDLVDKVMQLKRGNPKRAGEGELLAELARAFPDTWFKAAAVIERAIPTGTMGDDDLRAVLDEICPGKISARAIGKLLGRLRGRIINGYRLRDHGAGQRALEYRVELIEPDPQRGLPM